MPELPDIAIYEESLARHLGGQSLTGLRVFSPFVVRTFDPPISSLVGRAVVGARHLGKRLVLAFDHDLFLVIHLMISGRLRLKPPGAKPPGKMGLAALDFARGSVMFTEASTKKRASLHVVRGEAALDAFDRGGVDPLGATLDDFGRALTRERHTLKRSLVDPTLFSGIGNAYSDEILHAARLSPVKMSDKLTHEELTRLRAAAVEVLTRFTDALRREVGDGFPDEVTAFRVDMAVHGRHKLPCPRCQTPVQRIAYADNETNYCPTCQTDGKLLADRGLSRLLGKDWPKSLDELDELKRERKL